VAYRRRPEQVSALLAAAGLPVHAHAGREAEAGERTPHVYLLARKVSSG
jgi:hypothetical protein